MALPKLFHNGDFAEDESLYVALYNAQFYSMYCYGRSLGYRDDVLEDAIQEVFLNFMLRRSVLGKIRNVRTYLLRSLHNKLVDTRRRRVEWEEIGPGEEFGVTVTVLDDLIEDEQKCRISRNLEQALARLSGRQRQAVYMRFMHEMEYRDIASLLECTEVAVRQLVSKGLQKMRDNAGEDFNEE